MGIEKEIEITRVGLEGQGVGTDEEGKIYFVERCVPGDRVRIQVFDEKKKYRDGKLVAIVVPSMDRIVTSCRYFEECGGCDWLHWSYEKQVQAKQKILQYVLEKNGWKPAQYHPFLGATQTQGYRNRVQVRTEGGKLGFLKKRGHEIIDIEECKVAKPEINQAIRELRQRLLIHNTERKKIEISTLEEGGGVVLFENEMHGAGGFRQIHDAQNKILQSKVAERVREGNPRVGLELFCGDGNLSFPILKESSEQIKEWIGIEGNEQAIQKANQKREREIEKRKEGENQRPEFFRGKLNFFQTWIGETTAKKLPKEFQQDCDTLVLDPPRTGIRGGLKPFLFSNLQQIIYISCSPISFIQDCRDLKKEYWLDSVQGLDMFPQTRHIEFIAKWIRKKTISPVL